MFYLTPHTRNRSEGRVPAFFNDSWVDDFFKPLKTFEGEGNYCFQPSVDVLEDDEKYLLRADLPGVDKKDVKIEYKNGVLTISGEKKSDDEEKKDKYYRRERCYGSFRRAFNVGDGIDTEKIKADYKDGILSLSLPKKEEEKAREIQIN